MPKRTSPPRPGWSLATVAIVAMMAASAALAAVSNPHYDSNATVGGLHKVCDDFSIDATDVLSASCNKSTAGIVSKVSSSISLRADLDTECFGQFSSLTPQADRVKIVYSCNLHTDDLNDMVKWDATAGTLKLTAA